MSNRQVINGVSMWLVGLLLALSIAPTLAQEDDPAPRQSDRLAPSRDVTVLAQDEDGRSVAQTLIEIPAEADAYIASDRPNENFGSAALYVGYHNSGEDRFGAERSLIRFDLSSIPPGATILEARLRLYMSFATPSDGNPMRIIARQLNSAWDEQFVTWNTEPMWGDVQAEAFVNPVDGWYEWDLSGLVGNWMSGQTINHGVEMIGDERVQQRERAFNSRETQSNLYPRLLVRYSEQSDTEPPNVTVNPLGEYAPRNFTIAWQGSDAGGSGIAYYDVQYQVDGGTWTDWQIGVTSTSAEFTGGNSGRTYAFRARGVDNAGNVEPFGDAESSTTVDVNVPVAVVDPLSATTSLSDFVVSWSGTDIGSFVVAYDIRYRLNGGEWILWLNNTSATSALFSTPVDGYYEFEARAIDAAGLQEPFIGAVESAITVDARAPYNVPPLWLPRVLK